MTVSKRVSRLKTKYRTIELFGTLCIISASILSMYIMKPIHHIIVLNIAAFVFILFIAACTVSYKEELKIIMR